ncbi:MAG: 30S ribosomal protein S12 methylthiotransferase RimO [Gammaproteobacteria bacterium]|jgi:ribosomal protein S12 methylthiotransferase|nr:30S ribosomal protein S12 methylthiotransferase RimO [Gammaproteobacteria bacterium]MBT3721908.1 30S ribosomal protein S12 methylthiotransferase RimO [Gammaproteobacteria bacterium]MBT4075236.1 30S ribosomal protein S12 methylthiotransferase RimO [Gammaproteobacteria bacterium]MBT4193677.1 30S ribosomal protein S12 methylthiotransferase RimO [Gammaproteobacteria bacterium]MBT4448915.1 30S ribosomal protein S12 methylthiotransferase RimO [Gammaproteobacteria bacterium]
MTQIKNKVGFISLGCPKATVDSEQIITQLSAEGYDIVPEYDQADMVIINTCGFIDSAVEESMQTIDEALHENGKVIVTGCLGAKSELVSESFPNLLAVTGPHATAEVMQAVHKHLPARHDPFMDLVPAQGIKLTPQHYAYLKISEGCNHRCTFCIIPSFRGDLVSRQIDEVMQEAQNLVNAGVKELLVISQDTSAYGVDVKYSTKFWNGQPLQTRFVDLARALGQFGIWVRMHYVYPYPHVDNVIPLMADGLILPYLDIPFQHASPKILKAMKRPGSQQKVLERIHNWRQICPELVIRSTFIVGFPGETEEDFQMLLDFLTEAQLDRVGCFMYSPVEGAVANELPDQVDEQTKQSRFERFMLHQQVISTNRLSLRIGQTMQVLLEEPYEEGWTGRSYADAPEIDGVVFIRTEQTLQAGQFVQVTITASDEYDIFAEL